MDVINARLNNQYLKRYASALLPLIDIINHRQPKRADYSDLVSSDVVSYQLSITTAEAKKGKDSERQVGLMAMTKYSVGEEFNYSYSRNLDVLNLLISYGIAFDNSPYGVNLIQTSNLVK